MRVVINKCHGGFGLSDKAYEKLNEWGMSFTKIDGYWEPYGWGRDNRADTLLIRVVEELGEEANGDYAELKVVEIPDDVAYDVQEYDGLEWIAEVHQTWG